MIINKLQKNKAFTLIELMVATTIFAIVMLMGVGALLSASSAAKSAHRLQVAVDNVNFAMEGMTRELRTGTHYLAGSNNQVSLYVTNPPTTGDGTDNSIAFTPQLNPSERVAYVVKSGELVRESSDDHVPYSVTSPDVTISSVKFIVNGSNSTDNIQPSVEIIMKGVVNLGNGTPFVLQSMASQRSAE